MIYESKSIKRSQDVADTSDHGYEYRSESELFGLPLIHITRGKDPHTGRRRVSKGIVAIGGLALGVISLGAVSVGLYFAMGTMALSLMYAIGWQALAPHYIDANGISESFLRMIRQWLSFIA